MSLIRIETDDGLQRINRSMVSKWIILAEIFAIYGVDLFQASGPTTEIVTMEDEWDSREVVADVVQVLVRIIQLL